jgi:hypothetical protein
MAFMLLLRACVFSSLMLAANISHALPDAVVEGIQMPAWFTREGTRQPLAPGTALESSDEVVTGPNSRLLLRLADGSAVKLGENGRLQLAAMRQSPKQRFLAATLKVIEGAFRFTTEAAMKMRRTRDITVQFPTLTAGIRGTDIWGKNLGDRQVLVLIEGKITVSRAGDKPLDMADPLTYLSAERGGAASVQRVDTEQLRAWAAETELAEGQGAVRKGGRWKLYLGDFRQQLEALVVYDSLRRDGYPVRIQPQQSEGAQLYRLRLAGFATEQDASALGARLKQANPRLEPVASLQ